eukprot:541607-Prymnesium_polylepis.1
MRDDTAGAMCRVLPVHPVRYRIHRNPYGRNPQGVTGLAPLRRPDRRGCALWTHGGAGDPRGVGAPRAIGDPAV